MQITQIMIIKGITNKLEYFTGFTICISLQRVIDWDIIWNSIFFYEKSHNIAYPPQGLICLYQMHVSLLDTIKISLLSKQQKCLALIHLLTSIIITTTLPTSLQLSLLCWLNNWMGFYDSISHSVLTYSRVYVFHSLVQFTDRRPSKRSPVN